MDIQSGVQSSDELNIVSKPVYRLVKRVVDVLLAMLGLIVLSPVMLVTALAIKLEDGGPIFFNADRVGLNEKTFKMYKFRSMKVGAHELQEELKQENGCDEVSLKIENDPRITGVGQFIRKTSIDELPQLLNIIKGDMSIVGPRPLPTYEYEEEKKVYGNKFSLRYSVPQGLTCYWQVSGRSNIEFEKRMQMDVNYAKESGVLTDIKVFFLTFKAVFSGEGAY